MRNVISIVILLLLHLSLSAQDVTLASKTLQNNIEKFEQYVNNDYNKALYYANLVDSDLDSTAISIDAARIYDFLADNSETHRFRYHDALRYKHRSHRIYEQLGERHHEITALSDLGRLYFRVGEYHHAFAYCTQVQQVADATADRIALRETYLTMELVDYFYHKDTASAMRINREVAESYNNTEEARQAVRALNNRFHYQPTPHTVEEVLKLSEQINEQYDVADLMINIYLNVALQQIIFDDLDACAEYLALAKPMIRNIKDEGYWYSASGFYHVNNGDVQRAIEDTRHSIEILSDGDFDEKNVHSYFLLQELYRIEGRWKEAYEALMYFAQTYTRQNDTESAIMLSKMVSDLKLQQTEAEYRDERERMEQKQRYDDLLWRIHAYGLIVLAVVGILLLSRIRLQRKNHRLYSAKVEQELKHKNELMRLQKLQQYQEKHNAAQLTEELVMIANTQDPKEIRTGLKRIIARLHKSGDTATDWVEVEKMMVDNNDIFFDNLLREYPNLTKNERKLCTFIHLNLSTKEIASITHQSVGSIHIARARLRKKFGISGDDKSLIAFLDRFNNKPE